MKYYRVRTNRHIYWRDTAGTIKYCSVGGFTATSDLNRNARGDVYRLIPLTFNYILNMNLEDVSAKYKEYILKVLKELVHEHKT